VASDEESDDDNDKKKEDDDEEEVRMCQCNIIKIRECKYLGNKFTNHIENLCLSLIKNSFLSRYLRK